jgi:hypothetical protein
MGKWIETTEERYDEMLGVLPPALMLGNGFLVGEPCTHRDCSVSGSFRATYSPFGNKGGKFYEYSESLTVPEFRKAVLELPS